MARVTVEDCIVKIPNRFELVMLSSQRAREIGSGAEMMVDRDNDKNPVVALREIADTDISLDGLRDALVRNYQKVIEVEEDESEIVDMMEGEQEWAAVAEQEADAEQAVERGDLHEEAELEDDAAADETLSGDDNADETEEKL